MCFFAGPELVLKSKVIAIGSELDMNEVGMEDEALLCRTPYENCCKSNRQGEWYSIGQDGSRSPLPLKGAKQPLFRNRGAQVVRLNNRAAGASAAGLYQCCIPNSCGEEQCIDITLGKHISAD